MLKRITVFLVLLVIASQSAVAAPKPRVAQSSKHWTLKTDFEHPKQISFRVPGQSEPQTYWYVILSMENTYKEDVSFFPKFELMTDTFKISTAGKDVPKSVYDLIMLQNQGKYPFLHIFEKANSKVLHGEDNMVDILVVWKDFDGKAKNIKLFFAGLSNETVSIKHPTKKDANGNPVKYYLTKTLEINYHVPGDQAVRARQKLIYKGKRWIMR